MAYRCPVTDCRLEDRAASRKQIIAGVGAALIGLACGDLGHAPCVHGSRRDLDFGARRTACQIFDRGPVEIAGWEIHREIQRAGAQHVVDWAHALEQF